MDKENLLTFGIPGSAFTGFLEKEYPPREWRLLCAESRPHEGFLAARLNSFTDRGFESVLITDNMVGFCLSRGKVKELFLHYRTITGNEVVCQGGSLLMAVLAREFNVPVNLFPTDFDPEKVEISKDLSFAGDTIVTGGVKSYVPRVDRVPMSLVAKVWDGGKNRVR